MGFLKLIAPIAQPLSTVVFKGVTIVACSVPMKELLKSAMDGSEQVSIQVDHMSRR